MKQNPIAIVFVSIENVHQNGRHDEDAKAETNQQNCASHLLLTRTFLVAAIQFSEIDLSLN
jgi:hypothetical protein